MARVGVVVGGGSWWNSACRTRTKQQICSAWCAHNSSTTLSAQEYCGDSRSFLRALALCVGVPYVRERTLNVPVLCCSVETAWSFERAASRIRPLPPYSRVVSQCWSTEVEEWKSLFRWRLSNKDVGCTFYLDAGGQASLMTYFLNLRATVLVEVLLDFLSTVIFFKPKTNFDNCHNTT